MLNRRLFATGLAAGALAAPGLSRAQKSDMRRTLDPNVAMPPAGKRPWAQQVPQLRVGLLGGENEADRLGRFDGYRKLLEETFERPADADDRVAAGKERLRLGLADVDAENLTPAALMDAVSDHQRLGHHAAAVTDFLDLRVEEQVRVGALQRPAAERVNVLIKRLADSTDFGLRDTQT